MAIETHDSEQYSADEERKDQTEAA